MQAELARNWNETRQQVMQGIICSALSFSGRCLGRYTLLLFRLGRCHAVLYRLRLSACLGEAAAAHRESLLFRQTASGTHQIRSLYQVHGSSNLRCERVRFRDFGSFSSRILSLVWQRRDRSGVAEGGATKRPKFKYWNHKRSEILTKERTKERSRLLRLRLKIPSGTRLRFRTRRLKKKRQETSSSPTHMCHLV